ncbi:MAG: c-type cytochrome [Lewinella sp.]|nr:c-type cytochrome [Lewinella sp.]
MNNKIFISLSLLLLAVPALAQDGAATTNNGPLEWAYGNLVILLGGLIIIGAFLALYNVTNMLLQAQKIRILQEHGIEVLQKVAPSYDKPWWQRMYDRWTDVVPIEKEDEILIEHPHDGIYELDNTLPPWWLALFYISIAFAVVYLGYYHVFGYGQNQLEQFDTEMVQSKEAVEAYLATQADQVDETNVTVLTDQNDLALGQTIFTANCQVCHGALGEGGIGPNMTDQYWIHGGDIKDLFRTIKYGVTEKGMQSWESLLRPADMQRVASYILTLQGTNPPNAKEPQGDLYQPEQAEGPDTEAPATETGEEGDALGMNQQ